MWRELSNTFGSNLSKLYTFDNFHVSCNFFKKEKYNENKSKKRSLQQQQKIDMKLGPVKKTAENVIRSWELFVLYCIQFGLIFFEEIKKTSWE